MYDRSAMGYRREPFAPEEWYHCYSRGIDKREVFETPEHFARFIELLYLANDTKLIDRAGLRDFSHEEILSLPRESPLVAIAAYCLMGNHFHLLLQEKSDHGISKFMHKIGTGYTKYFNLQHERIGNLLVKPFRSKHVSDGRYFKRAVEYIHLNPAELFERGWKDGVVRDMHSLERNMLTYPHSSLIDYSVASPRIERGILDPTAFDLLGSEIATLSDILTDAAAYYAELPKEFRM